MYRTSWSRWVLCPRVSRFFCIFNTLLLSLLNIAHPNFCFGSQRHRCAFLYSIPSSTQSTSLYFSFFIPTLSVTHRNTGPKNGFICVISAFLGTWWRRMSVGARLQARLRMIKEQGSVHVWLEYVLPLSVIHFLLIFPCLPWLFLVPFPGFLRVQNLFPLSNQWFLNVIQVILTQYFCLLRRFESPNLCACVRTGSAWYKHLHYRPLLLTLYQHWALPWSWRRPWWWYDLGLRFYFDTGDTMPRCCEPEDGANEFVRILCSQHQYRHHHWPLHFLSTLMSPPQPFRHPPRSRPTTSQWDCCFTSRLLPSTALNYTSSPSGSRSRAIGIVSLIHGRPWWKNLGYNLRI